MMESRVFQVGGKSEEVFRLVVDTLRQDSFTGTGPSCLVRIVSSSVFSAGRLGITALETIPLDPDALRKSHRLSRTQAQVALMVAARLSNAEIATLLHCQPSTVRSHLSWIFTRMNVTKREEIQDRVYSLWLESGRGEQ
jgi:DNA-binding CsgD family transcriptional regulator